MSVKVQCEQFIFSKYTGAPRSASYTTIAKSSEEIENLVPIIRREFNGLRPISTDLASYTTSYALAPIEGNRLALLRMDVTKDAESKSNLILHERYWILNWIQLKENRIKPWKVLVSMPEPEEIFEHRSLSNVIELPNEHLPEKAIRASKNLSNSKDVFRTSVLVSLYSLLNSLRVSVSLNTGIFDIWNWLTTLEVLLPISFEVKLRLLLGSSISKEWIPDLGLTSEIIQASKEKGIELVSDSGELPTLECMLPGYADFVRRCYESKDAGLFSNLLAWGDGLDPEIYDSQRTSYDLLLKSKILPDIRLDLARLEFQNNKAVVDDLYWLWQNGNLTEHDVQKFLPTLLSEKLEAWSESDFITLSKYTDLISSETMIDIIANSAISAATPIKLVMKWGQLARQFTDSDKSLCTSLLAGLTNQQAEATLNALAQCLKHFDLGDSQKIQRILRALPETASIHANDLWKLILWSFDNVKKQTDMAVCYDILSCANFLEEFKLATDFLGYLLQKNKPEGGFCSAITRLIDETNQMQVLQRLLPTILNLTLLSHYPSALIELALALKSTRFLSRYWFNTGPLLKSREQIVLSRNERYISAYIFFLSKLGISDVAKDILTSILIDNSDLFARIAAFVHLNYSLNPDEFSISATRLRDFSPTEQLQLWFMYCILTSKFGEVKQKLYGINRLLMGIESLDGIDAGIIENFLHILFKSGEWNTACRILEHQVRSAILAKRLTIVQAKLGELYRVASKGKKIDIGIRAKSEMVISYIRALPQPALNEFMNWFLALPFSMPPPIRNAHFQPFTTRFLANHLELFTDNVLIRYFLFEEIFTWERLR